MFDLLIKALFWWLIIGTLIITAMGYIVTSSTAGTSGSYSMHSPDTYEAYIVEN